MTYLTRVPAERIENHGETFHQMVMSLFPETLPGDVGTRRSQSNILFMVDGPNVIISSDVQPDPDKLPSPSATIRPRTEFAEGSVIRFRAAVNPIARRRTGGVRVVDTETWLAEKTAGALTHVTVHTSRRTTVDSGRSPVIVDTVDGEAVVTDPTQLARLLRTGIGRQKPFGCGLMMATTKEVAA
ncbi:type I-E CRISPR-associated protein Cas6/Cse3/CasE [Leifsonia sp. Leaf264]|uniref:type I-E CRISPR-associated protein Cas6/Cse3/CasE n=1 Tax=Leifsonia sp. Leaf264 TaxID=1736314 RepID=UPI000701E1F7|nr:type I-E CRISPR-associated protein Cas6/Cse3/CasE [Leifsonia sp. Leaf264]KQO98764.1 hypothetical protein ASF30_11930 [Leifsonia sp. Leaf264]